MFFNKLLFYIYSEQNQILKKYEYKRVKNKFSTKL